MSGRDKSLEGRPWAYDPKAPVRHKQVRFQWNTSIPENWIRLRGRSHFHKEKERKKVGTFDYMKETLQYIDSITATSPSSQSLPKVLLVSPRHDPPHEISPEPTAVPERPRIKEFSMALSDNWERKRPLLAMRASNTQAKLERTIRGKSQQAKSLQVLTLTLASDGLPGDNHYLVNKYSRPKALIPVPKSKPDPKSHSRHSSELGDFLMRFDITAIPKLPPRSRKGLNGWKLSRVKPARVTLSARKDLNASTEQADLQSMGGTMDEQFLRLTGWRDNEL